MNPDGSNLGLLPGIEYYDSSYFDFSKDGNAIFFRGRTQVGGVFRLFKVNVDGSDFVELYDASYGEVEHICVSPSNDEIMFVRNLYGDRDFYLIDAEGGLPEVFLDLPETQLYPHWK